MIGLERKTRQVALTGRPSALLALLAVAACAAHTTLPPPVVQPSPIVGRVETGTVLSIRSVDLTADPAVTRTIFGALGVSQSYSAATDGVEITIMRPDQSVTSIVQSSGAAQQNFAVGEKVAIIEARSTVLRPE